MRSLTLLRLIVSTLLTAALAAPVLAQPYSEPGSTLEDGTGGDREGVAADFCPPAAADTLLVSQLTGNVLQAASWAATPDTGVRLVADFLEPHVRALTSFKPWPEISDRARQARVPVMMYHDVLPEKQVFFDVTTEELRRDFELIREQGLTPISMDTLVAHLSSGAPLPPKPVLLTFDDGYEGHYTRVYPLMKEFGYPAVFSIFPAKVNGDVVGRSTLTWAQLKEMVQDPLVTIASHSVTHPRDLTQLSDAQMKQEIVESKRILQEQLGVPIRYFTYPEGHYDAKVIRWVKAAGYVAALTMSDVDERFAGKSDDLLTISRFGQSRLEEVLPDAWGGPKPTASRKGFDFTGEIEKQETVVNGVPLVLISGGRPITIHADSRYQVQEILEGTEAIAGVDGGFFSLEFLDSNQMIGPVLGQNTGKFVPGQEWDRRKIVNRPLVLIGPRSVRFVPFDPEAHNTLEGIRAELPDVTDAFVAAAFLVEDGQPQPPSRFGDLFDFNEPRHRAFWGINQAGQPKIGVTTEPVGSVELGEILAKSGFRDAVMLDSGASTSLAYQGASLVGYIPRPVPHVVALVPPGAKLADCPTAQRSMPQRNYAQR